MPTHVWSEVGLFFETIALGIGLLFALICVFLLGRHVRERWVNWRNLRRYRKQFQARKPADP
ncbi:MAG: hypothetical protein ACXW12_15330, partial [Burkholderiales bacterium]